ncbi:hypothetical protein CCACVL1_02049 [Corchorus capsularis]|uniref:Uncharacterized protein n=1 Tax=Corchorus capsularis TaxID=210143 RepID=A0A1R3K6T1_COCAP|nr:hypothetical protein CCACVL1_02702 [Corchorus capsularis]OMP05138.1 hypothetical protein CCACVL1_02049 [Corchorus capsularis]
MAKEIGKLLVVTLQNDKPEVLISR